METKLCPQCKGSGKTEYWESGHNPDKIVETCTKCKGSGRVLTDEYRVMVPFGINEDRTKEYYEVNRKIIELIRDYEERCYSIILNESPFEVHEENK